MSGIDFARPDALHLLWIVPAAWLLTWPWAGGGVLFARADSARSHGGRRTIRTAFALGVPRLLRGLALASAILALAEPRAVETVQVAGVVGKGIGLAVDLSTSMLATDMDGGRSRIDVAREAAMRFAAGREHDELSLIGFAGEAITRVPPTDDREVVVAAVETLGIQLVRDGTDISAAVLTTAARLMESEREPRVVILLTDGAHNGTTLPPLAAARAAAALGVKVHAISVLPPEDPARPARPYASANPEEEMRTVLGGIAEITGGSYFHAVSSAALDSIYAEVDRLEAPTETLTDREVPRPLRLRFLVAGLLLLGLDMGLRASRWGVIS